ncbi:hypothetical protein TNCV_3274301 [Trichonephila clavipes]|nr:hypothetical protein TNCV_3274301 [Trichonephila clavipes]
MKSKVPALHPKSLCDIKDAVPIKNQQIPLRMVIKGLPKDEKHVKGSMRQKVWEPLAYKLNLRWLQDRN